MPILHVFQMDGVPCISINANHKHGDLDPGVFHHIVHVACHTSYPILIPSFLIRADLANYIYYYS